jgi:hypothetical protein
VFIGKMSPFGPVLGRFGPFWAVLGRFWSFLGRFWPVLSTFAPGAKMAHFEHFRAVLVVLSGFGVCKWVICVHFEHSKSPFQTLFRGPKSVQNGLILSTFEPL